MGHVPCETASSAQIHRRLGTINVTIFLGIKCEELQMMLMLGVGVWKVWLVNSPSRRNNQPFEVVTRTWLVRDLDKKKGVLYEIYFRVPVPNEVRSTFIDNRTILSSSIVCALLKSLVRPH